MAFLEAWPGAHVGGHIAQEWPVGVPGEGLEGFFRKRDDGIGEGEKHLALHTHMAL